MKVVVTGAIGSGKSTAVRAALRRLGWTAPAGFSTHWNGAARGADVLWLETWSGEKRPLAHRRAAPAPGQIPYELVAEFPEIAVASWATAGAERPVVLDELGALEWAAPEFPAAVARLFRGPAPVLAVIQRRALERWLAAIGREHIDVLLELDPARRADWPEEIARFFRV